MSPDICAALVVCQAAKPPGPGSTRDQWRQTSTTSPRSQLQTSPELLLSNISTAAAWGGVWFTVRTSHAVRGFAICDDALRSEVCHHLVHQMLDYVVWMHRLNWRQQYVICAQATLRRKWVRNNAIFRHQSMQNVPRRTVRFNARGPPGWFLKCYGCYGKYKIVQEKL